MTFIGSDGWIYIKKDLLSYDDYIKVRSNLINIKPFDRKGLKKNINLYREHNGYMILPRQFGFRTIYKYGVKFNYIKNNKLWYGNKYHLEYKMKYTLYSYQTDAVHKVLKSYNNGSYGGIIKLPTGSGKTLVSLEIARRLGRKTLIVVKTKPLARQWAKELKNFYGDDVKYVILSNISNVTLGKEYIELADFVICVRNTLMKRGDSFKYKSFKSIGTVIIDEIHSMLSEKVLSMFQIISRRFIMGITATPKTLNGLDFLMNYYIGPIIYSLNKSYEGKKPLIYFINYKTPREKRKIIKYESRMDYINTYMNILRDVNRLDIIVKLVNTCLEDKDTKKIIVIAQFRFIIDYLHKKLGSISGTYYSVRKKGDKKKQDETINKKRVILAIQALGKESLNIIDCNRLIMATAPIINKDEDGKWNCQQMTQMIGRCLRQKWKKPPKIYVMNDMFSVFINHWKKRKIYFRDIRGDEIIII